MYVFLFRAAMPSERSHGLSHVVVTGYALATHGVACGGSTGASVGAVDASSGDASPDAASMEGGSPDGGGASDSGTTSGDDGSSSGDDGGQVVDDGGSNPVLDGGDDGGGDTEPDGGACNALANASPSVSSACASLEPILAGGELVPGTYYLTGVTAYAVAAFCKTGFIPVGIKETAVITVNGGVGSVESVSQLATTRERRTSETFTPGANNASPLTAQTTCPATTGSEQVKYDVRANAGKTVLVLRLPYGKGMADYRLGEAVMPS